jgi:hypothetical protein
VNKFYEKLLQRKGKFLIYKFKFVYYNLLNIIDFFSNYYIYSSNSLNTKKKSYPSNLLKIPHVFMRSNEVKNIYYRKLILILQEFKKSFKFYRKELQKLFKTLMKNPFLIH